MSELAVEAALAGAAIVLFASLVQSSLGFGFGMVALPFMALLMPGLMPQVLVALSAFNAGLVAWRERAHIDWQLVRPLLPSRTLGVLPGAALVAVLSPRALDLVFGLVGVAAVVAVVAPRVHIESLRALIATGVVSGAMGTATGLGGPPLVVAMGARTPTVQRSTMALTLAGGNLLSLIGLGVIGRIGLGDAMATAMLIVPLGLGFAVSALVVRLVPDRAFRATVIALCAAASVVVLVRGLLG